MDGFGTYLNTRTQIVGSYPHALAAVRPTLVLVNAEPAPQPEPALEPEPALDATAEATPETQAAVTFDDPAEQKPSSRTEGKRR